jgi:hypothetical protein
VAKPSLQVPNSSFPSKPQTPDNYYFVSGPEDVVFVYYADHGGPGILGLPEVGAYRLQLKK